MGQVVPARAASRPGNCGLACYMTLKQLIPLFVAAFYRRCLSETNFPKGNARSRWRVPDAGENA
jgi:hypothetical protein